MSTPQITPRILCAGEVVIDLIGDPAEPIPETERFLPHLGGAPANVAVALTCLGLQTALLTRLGEDEFGKWATDELLQRNIRLIPGNRAHRSQTRIAIVSGSPASRRFTFYGSPAADTLLDDQNISDEELAQFDALYLTGLPLATEPPATTYTRLACRAHSAGVAIIFDPNPRHGTWSTPAMALDALHPVLRRARIVKMSRDDLMVLETTPDEIRQLLEPTAIIVITDGEHGLTWWNASAWNHVDACEASEVDATGAGDAFTAALIHQAIMSSFRLSDSDLRFASVAGSISVEKYGAMNAMPSHHQIIDRLNSNPSQ